MLVSCWTLLGSQALQHWNNWFADAIARKWISFAKVTCCGKSFGGLANSSARIARCGKMLAGFDNCFACFGGVLAGFAKVFATNNRQQQTANNDNTQQTTNNRQQTTDNRQQTDNRQPTTDNWQQITGAAKITRAAMVTRAATITWAAKITHTIQKNSWPAICASNFPLKSERHIYDITKRAGPNSGFDLWNVREIHKQAHKTYSPAIWRSNVE